MARAGQPPIFATPEELQEKIDKYFEFIKGKLKTNKKGETSWETEPQPVTITGLCLYLGFESRQSFYDYGKNEKFSYTIRKAHQRVELSYEKNLRAQNVAGSIFALKNLGWKDKVETGFTDNEGNDINPVSIFKLPDNGRDPSKTED